MSDLGDEEQTGSYSIYFAEGEALAKQKQFQKAIESFTKASRGAPSQLPAAASFNGPLFQQHFAVVQYMHLYTKSVHRLLSRTVYYTVGTGVPAGGPAVPGGAVQMSPAAGRHGHCSGRRRGLAQRRQDLPPSQCILQITHCIHCSQRHKDTGELKLSEIPSAPSDVCSYLP